MKTFYDYQLSLNGATMDCVDPADTFIYWDEECDSPVNGRVFIKTSEANMCVDLRTGDVVDFTDVDVKNCHFCNIAITCDNVYLRD